MFTWWFWGMLNEAHLSTYTMVSSFPDLYVKQNISQKKCNPNKPKVRVKKGCCHNITQTKKTFRFNLRMIPLNFEVWVTIVFNKSCPGKFMGQGVAKRDLGDKPFYWRSTYQFKTFFSISLNFKWFDMIKYSKETFVWNIPFRILFLRQKNYFYLQILYPCLGNQCPP